MMPAESGKQYRMMAMAAQGKKPNKMNSVGPSQKVAKEFVSKTPAKKRKIFARRDSDY